MMPPSHSAPADTRIFSAPNLASAELMKAALEAEGIEAEIRGEQLTSLAGAIPVDQSWLQLWVRSGDADRATAILEQEVGDSAGAERLCPACGELSPAHFGACWSCGGDLSSALCTSDQAAASLTGAAPSGAPVAVIGSEDREQ